MVFDIVNDRLEIGGKAAQFVSANAYGARFHPTLIIVHDTADRPQPKDTVNWFASKACKVSAHFVVERDGSITQMVPCDHKAYHAGKSSWPGQSGGCNNFAIGIEIDNPGKLDKNGRGWFHKKGEPGIEGIVHAKTKEHGDGYWLPYTPEQIETVSELCIALVAYYPTIKEIGAHWLISPGRKIDTNPLFPLEELRDAVFKKKAVPGRPAAYPRLQLGDQGEAVKAAQVRLKELGYPAGDPDGIFGPQMRVAVLAFEAENNLVYDACLETDEHKLLMADAGAKAMPVGSRSELTAEDLKAKGSETVTWVLRCKKIIGTAIVTPIVGVADKLTTDGAGATAALDTLEATRTTASRTSDLLGWVLTPIGLGIGVGVALLVLVYYGLDRIEKKRVADARSGANIAR